jgi:hypothetical protein
MHNEAIRATIDHYDAAHSSFVGLHITLLPFWNFTPLSQCFTNRPCASGALAAMHFAFSESFLTGPKSFIFFFFEGAVVVVLEEVVVASDPPAAVVPLLDAVSLPPPLPAQAPVGVR